MAGEKPPKQWYTIQIRRPDDPIPGWYDQETTSKGLDWARGVAKKYRSANSRLGLWETRIVEGRAKLGGRKESTVAEDPVVIETSTDKARVKIYEEAAPVEKPLDKLLRQHALEAQKLQNEQAADFLRILKQTESEIVGKLASGTTDFSSALLNKILAETKTSIYALEQKAQGFYQGAVAAQADLAVQQAVGEITRMSSLIDGVPLDLSLDAAASMSSATHSLLANSFESSVQRYGLDVLQKVRQRIQVGMITGDTSGVAREVQGAISGTKSQAERIVRTETSNAYGAARHGSIDAAGKKIPGLKKTWIHQGSYPCPTCIPLDGTERPLNGTWTITIGKHTRKVAHPPAHPHCVCSILGMKSSWKDKLQKLGYL